MYTSGSVLPLFHAGVVKMGQAPHATLGLQNECQALEEVFSGDHRVAVGDLWRLPLETRSDLGGKGLSVPIYRDSHQ